MHIAFLLALVVLWRVVTFKPGDQEEPLVIYVNKLTPTTKDFFVILSDPENATLDPNGSQGTGSIDGIRLPDYAMEFTPQKPLGEVAPGSTIKGKVTISNSDSTNSAKGVVDFSIGGGTPTSISFTSNPNIDTITAEVLGSFTASGSLDANITANSIAKFKVGGILGGNSTADYRQVLISNSLGMMNLGGLQNVSIFVGVDASITSLPTDESAFISSSAFIKSLTIKGTSAIFSDADVAATTIDAITIAGLQSDNSTPFGVVAEKILKYKQGKISKTKVTTPQIVDSSGEYSAKTV